MGAFLIPLLASLAGTVTSSAMGNLLADDPTKPKKVLGQLGSIQEANEKKPSPDPMADDILQQYLASMQQRRAA